MQTASVSIKACKATAAAVHVTVTISPADNYCKYFQAQFICCFVFTYQPVFRFCEKRAFSCSPFWFFFLFLREAGFLLFSPLILFLSLSLVFLIFFHVSFLFTAQATVRHNQLPHLTIKRLPCVSNLCLIINILDKNYCLCYDCSIWSFSETTIMSLSDDDLNEYWREYTWTKR